MNHLTLNRNRLWSPLTDIHHEVDRLFDGFWNKPAPSTQATQWSPSCEVEEADDYYAISLEIPGVPKDRLAVTFENNRIVISGERYNENKKKEDEHWYSERRYGKFQRSFTLPQGVETEKVEAVYQDGVLRITVPKPAVAKPRSIKINAA
jgi:HSP20 family protein